MTREMSPASPPNPPKPRAPNAAKGESARSGSGSSVRRVGAHGDPHVAAVEAHLDHAVAEGGRDLRRQVGERVHQRQARGGLDGRAEQRGGALRLLVTRGGGGREVLPQLGDVLAEIHDAIVASLVTSVKEDVVSGYARGMPDIVPLRVQLVAKTEFVAPDDVPWTTDAEGGEALAEFAGRACYQSWSKPNPRTATNAGYLRHILEVGHLSVLEHGTVSFYLTGVSRSLTHELIRHRHFSYSQLSQRYVPERNAAMVEPEVIAADAELHALFTEAAEASVKAYEGLLEGLEKRFADVPNATLRRKQARQAARAILPNATETRIVVTGNYRAWRHFIAMRATEHADVEIRALAVECLRQLQQAVPNVFADFEIADLDDGTEIASSPFVTEG